MSETNIKKIRIPALAKFKREGQKIAMLTAYDAVTGLWADSAGAQIVLVGDSLARAAMGMSSEIEISLDQMIYHSAAVSRAVRRALVVSDLPFMTYKVNAEQALINCGRMIREGKAEAVKMEGGVELAPTIERVAQAGIPVLAHIGLLPQSFHAQGGYRVQGRDEQGAARLLDDARAIEQAGAFGVVLEGMPAELGRQITQELTIPTIGIGAGAGCDGQVLVMADVLRLTDQRVPGLAKSYANLMQTATQALGEYVREVQEGTFPAPSNTY